MRELSQITSVFLLETRELYQITSVFLLETRELCQITSVFLLETRELCQITSVFLLETRELYQITYVFLLETRERCKITSVFLLKKPETLRAKQFGSSDSLCPSTRQVPQSNLSPDTVYPKGFMILSKSLCADGTYNKSGFAASLPSIQTLSAAHPVSYAMGAGGAFPLDIKQPDRETDILLMLM